MLFDQGKGRVDHLTWLGHDLRFRNMGIWQNETFVLRHTSQICVNRLDLFPQNGRRDPIIRKRACSQVFTLGIKRGIEALSAFQTMGLVG